MDLCQKQQLQKNETEEQLLERRRKNAERQREARAKQREWIRMVSKYCFTHNYTHGIKFACMTFVDECIELYFYAFNSSMYVLNNNLYHTYVLLYLFLSENKYSAK